MLKPTAASQGRAILCKLVPAIAAALFAIGCKPEGYKVEAAVGSSIYKDRSFFDQVCGFPIALPVQVRVDILETDGEPLPWLGFWGGDPVPGTATIRLTKVVKNGETSERTCQAKIGFQWRMEKRAITDRVHRSNEMDTFYLAEGFKKL